MKRSATAATVMATALLGLAPGFLGAAVGAAAPARHSAIFAGYEVSKPNAHIKYVTATFVVPTITCDHKFGGVGPSVLVYSNINQQTGTHRTSGGGVGVACENGNPFYQSVFIVNDKTVQGGLVTFTPGDVVVVSVKVTSAQTKVTIDDTTTSVSRSHVGAGKIASQTFIGDNSVNVDGVAGPLDPFTKTQVTNVQIDNQPLGSNHAHRYIWVKNGTTLVTASHLSADQNFTLTFRNSG
ncbi:MAG TPA: G1 family glutamic endopeptidase [Mycobacteriales bacterium]|nr:G1 family glutamic endopeptidase [Mycobacteriales bacterium]